MKIVLLVYFTVILVSSTSLVALKAKSNNEEAVRFNRLATTSMRRHTSQQPKAASSSRSQEILATSRRLLRRMHKQNEINSESLSQCYEQLGKYTRLLLAHNHFNSSSSGFLSSSDQQFIGFKRYVMFVLQNELGYYLNELERNYKVISDLQMKLINLNRSIMSTDSLHFGGTIDRYPTQFSYHNKSIDLDCTMVVGTGFIQMDLLSPNQYDQQDIEHAVLNKITVYCEYGWLVIQQRLKGYETNFNRTWKEYSLGFGSLKGDFWLGLEIVHRLTQQRPHELMIELTDWSDQMFTARYDSFEVGSEEDQYRLSLSGAYWGNASKDFLDDAYNGLSSQNGAPFSTYDKWWRNHHQAVPTNSRNCALRSGGGWWFAIVDRQQAATTDVTGGGGAFASSSSSSAASPASSCLPVNLNGVYVNGASAPSTRGIKWQAVRPFDRNYSLKWAKMKIRPRRFTGRRTSSSGGSDEVQDATTKGGGDK